MTNYAAPLRDIDFVLNEVVGFGELSEMDTFAHADPDTTRSVIEEYARFIVDVLAPTNQDGDRQGAKHHSDGSVTTPDAFPDIYRQFVEAGWGSVPFAPEHGGGGFPWTVGIVMQELLTSANMAFSLCPLLTQGAIDALLHHGTEEQQERYLRRMVAGEWTGTMNLTEPHAGSDVGALSTKAVAVGDGSYRITGTKIFITYGEHDMADQIIHLVLARLPDAPPGTRGISCFIVPKFLLDDAGEPGERNDVTCVSIEHKMGIHGSPTCVLSFGDDGEGAVGYLIGEENQGMRTMFTMMNNARLSVGLEGLAIGERAYQKAVEYASERVQGRAIGAPEGVTESAIVDHPDVRRMLMTMRTQVEALRCLIYLNAKSLDLSNNHPDADVAQAAKELADLLTPLSKGWGTDAGVEIASIGVQVHGGMGFIEETGAAQFLRDIRIGPIYEGTNGIQAADLVGRKLPMRGGGVVKDLVGRMHDTVAELRAAGDDHASTADGLADAVDALTEASTWLATNGASDPASAFAGSSPYLRMFGVTVGGWLLGQSAVRAQEMIDAGETGGAFDGDYLGAKIVSARFFAEQLLPQVRAQLPAVTAGAGDLFAIPTAQL